MQLNEKTEVCRFTTVKYIHTDILVTIRTLGRFVKL